MCVCEIVTVQQQSEWFSVPSWIWPLFIFQNWIQVTAWFQLIFPPFQNIYAEASVVAMNPTTVVSTPIFEEKSLRPLSLEVAVAPGKVTKDSHRQYQYLIHQDTSVSLYLHKICHWGPNAAKPPVGKFQCLQEKVPYLQALDAGHKSMPKVMEQCCLLMLASSDNRLLASFIQANCPCSWQSDSHFWYAVLNRLHKVLLIR